MDEGARLRRLIDVGCGVLAPLDLDAVLRSVVEAARETTGARYAALGVLSESKQELSQFLASGIEPEVEAQIGGPPRGRGVLGELIRNPVALRLAEVSSHPRSFGFPPHHPRMRTFLGVPILVEGEAFGNLYMTEKTGGGAFEDLDQETAEILATWAGIAIEHARLYSNLSDRESALQRALRQVEASADIAEALDSETDLERILGLIVDRARALVEAGAVAVFLQRGTELTLAAATGEVTERMRGWTVPVEGSELGETVRTLVARSLSGPPAPREQGLRERLGAEIALLVPLQAHAGGLGVLVACGRADGEEFSDEDGRLLRAFASSASMAVAMAQSVEQQRLRERIDSAERERHHWAHELHDETLQQLAAIRIKLATALRSGIAPDSLAQATREAADDLEREIAALSRLIGELRPIPLETLGLDQALESLAQESAVRGSFDAETSIELEAPLSSEQERAIYRLVQESLNNVVKHSGAGRARIEARPGDGSLTIAVRDDGCGFDVEATPAGVGLNGMRERIELLGGVLEIDSSKGEGTLVNARIPVEPARE
jgi:signal transduction histidine kinase